MPHINILSFYNFFKIQGIFKIQPAGMVILCIFSALTGLSAKEGVRVSAEKNLHGEKYMNPVIHADYSDPDITVSADGKTFYMTASSFQCSPGLPILKSTDLVNWDLVNYALPTVPPVEYYNQAPRHGKGVWAPCIRLHNGEYYTYWGDPDFGIFMIKTENPEGRWSEPVLVKSGKGLIDPTPFWDEDGKAYLANGWAGSRAGFNSIITMSEMLPDGTAVISEPRIVYDGNDGVNHTVEGPKMYKRNGYYYLFSPAGGVAEGWQLVMRSKNIHGPYESKIVMAQGNSDINGPHQGAWIKTENNEDWFVHFQDLGAYGRVIHLNPMEWHEDWPVIGIDEEGDGCGQPVRKWQKPSVGKVFSSNTESSPALLFQWHGNKNDLFGFELPDGLMRIYGHKLSEKDANFWEVGNLWLQKFPAREFTFISKVRISAKGSSEGASSGIIVMGWDYARLGLTKNGDTFDMEFVTCTDAEQNGKEEKKVVSAINPTRVYSAGLYPNLECDLLLRVSVNKDGICSFSYSTDEKTFQEVGSFKARAGKWIGAKIGFYSVVPPEVDEKGWIDVITVETEIK